MVKALNADNFDKEVLAYEGKVLVDFWAEWCGPCMMLAPVIEELAEELDDVKVCNVNCDEARDLAFEHQIVTIPAVLYFENGEEKGRSIGFVDKQSLLELIG